MFYEISHLQEFSGSCCILYRDDTEDTVYSYGNVVEATQVILRNFQQLEISKYEGIALRLKDNTPALCVLLLGILNHRCHFCPLEFNAAPEEIRKHLLYSGARFLISNTAEMHEILQTDFLNHFNIYGEDFYISTVSSVPGPSTIANSLCYIISTSGSTGIPKMVHVPYASIRPNIMALGTRLQIKSEDVFYLCSPLTFDPFVVEFFLALQSGATLLIIPQRIRLKPSKLLSLLFPLSYSQTRRGVTILQMTPSIFRVFGAEHIRTIILKRGGSLSYLCSEIVIPAYFLMLGSLGTNVTGVLLLGGEQFPTQSEWDSWLPAINSIDRKLYSAELPMMRIFNIYGITEVSCWSTMHECDLYCRKASVFFPIGQALDDETVLRIVDRKGHVLPSTGQGELQIGSATRICHIPTTSVQNNMVSSRVDGVIYRSTGDLVQRCESGDIFYLGRTDSVVKRLGKRINLDALGLKIQDILCNKQIMVQVICLWDKTTNKLICCISGVVNNDLNKKLIIDQLLDYEKPDRFECLETLALNPNGKVDRGSLMRSLENPHSRKYPAYVLKSFLRDTLGLNITEGCDGTHQSPPQKRQKCSLDVSFRAAGGTSFHGLSLFTEMGQLLISSADQRILFEMLFNENVPLARVLYFLEHVPTVEVRSEIPLLEVSSYSRNLQLLWRVNLGKCVDAASAIFEHYICIGSHSHLLLTLDATSGRQLAQLTLPDRIECKVTFSSSPSMAFVGCYDGHLYAFDFSSGDILWRANVGGMIKAQPLVLEGTAIVGCYAPNFNLVCICLKTHRIQWRSKVGDRGIFAAPIQMSVTSVLACALDGSFARISSFNGKILWSRKCNSPIFSTPVLILNALQLVVAEVSGKVHICCTKNGEILHSFEVTGNIFSSITTYIERSGNIAIIFGCYDGHIYYLEYKPSLLNSETQLEAFTMLWKFSLNAPIYAMPALLINKGERFVVACSIKGLLIVLFANSGCLVATYDLKADVYSSPCLQQGDKMYLGCRDNFVYCFSFN